MGGVNMCVPINGAKSRLGGTEGLLLTAMPATLPKPLGQCQRECLGTSV